ncbi:MAG TPA: Xaa-Pro peptidase family protein [Anaerolineae bacterium]|nr:MAG: Aminopeptidase [Chloroflexi bacterium ADurb.Bin222]HOC22314.1 Xaa-Pro peptidase family protein [Anaerolineae bacterium]HOS79419.1 Xaa-Pro peptidase family protein [Anaerolineae bacterium]HQJ12537.1 Xaa-Pro peptidase family protein [Anaerolineae bacterium]HQM15229.1 Xaa-Pro peptidase family protein [Anaerolineae bacterium]
MKTDLDALMRERNLDAIVVTGLVRGNPPLIYLLNGALISHAIWIKKRDAEPTLIVGSMEREEAQTAGVPLILETRYNYSQLLREHAGDALAARVAFFGCIFEDLGVRGNVGFYGMEDQGAAYRLLRALDAALPEVTVVGEFGRTVLDEARATKSAAEVARIREAGRRTAGVVDATLAFLKQHAVAADETLRRADGAPLTVGEVHAFIRRQIALQDLEDPEGFIFSTGRDAGIPHSKGTLTAPMRLGESIVFDIFPREAGGGYFFDMTRTFCLGYAPPAVQRLYDDTRACLESVISQVEAGTEARRYQALTCACYRERGHLTIEEDPATLSGYVHTVGHGVGLDVHEEPFFREKTLLRPGHVFTAEPGLYYPDEGMGCRLEDVLWIDEAGAVHNLTDFPYDLVIPMG